MPVRHCVCLVCSAALVAKTPPLLVDCPDFMLDSGLLKTRKVRKSRPAPPRPPSRPIRHVQAASWSFCRPGSSQLPSAQAGKFTGSTFVVRNGGVVRRQRARLGSAAVEQLVAGQVVEVTTPPDGGDLNASKLFKVRPPKSAALGPGGAALPLGSFRMLSFHCLSLTFHCLSLTFP